MCVCLSVRAAAANIVPVTLELGGKCPTLVFEDADLDAAAATLTTAAIQHAGQTCSAVSRVVAAEPIHDELVARRGRYAALFDTWMSQASAPT